MTCWMKHESVESLSDFGSEYVFDKHRKRKEVHTLCLLLLFLAHYWLFYSDHHRKHLRIEVVSQISSSSVQKKKNLRQKGYLCLTSSSSSRNEWVFRSIFWVLFFLLPEIWTSSLFKCVLAAFNAGQLSTNTVLVLTDCWHVSHFSLAPSVCCLLLQGRIAGKRQAGLVDHYFFSSNQNHSGM